MKIKKSILFVLILLTNFATALAQSGMCGDEVQWRFENGLLYIDGCGKMDNYTCDKAPWSNFRDDIKELFIQRGVESIGDYAFNRCKNLTSVTIPNTVTSIGKDAFSNCINLTTITIPNSVTSIGMFAFLYCIGLTSIDVATDNPNYCSENGVLFNKDKTTLVLYPTNKTGSPYSIPNSVTSIGSAAFRGCRSLTSVTIPNSVTSIGAAAFMDSRSLTSVTIPNSVTSIGEAAFMDSRSLTSVTISNSVTSIGNGAFRACKSLTAINVASSNPNYTSIDGVLFDKNLTTLLSYPGGKQGAYTIPNSVTIIGKEAFKVCESLTSITIPNSVTSIGEDAFIGCSGLTSVTISNSVTSIGNGAFRACKSLTSVTIPNSVTKIGDGAFSYCSGLTSATIPNSIIELGSRIFKDCKNLQEIHYPEWMDLKPANICTSTHLIKYTAQKPNNMPILVLVDDVSFTDATGNSRIDSEEQCAIRFMIQNNGKGDAKNCEARVTLSGTTSGISAQTVKLPTIAVGDTYEVKIPVTSDINTQDGAVTFSIEVYEPNGWGVEPFAMNVTTKAYEPPFLKVVDYNVSSPSGKIKKVEPFKIDFNLQNVQYGEAEQVKVKIILPEYVYSMGETEFSFPSIKSGDTKTMDLVLAVNRNFSSDNVPITISIQEKYGKYAENRTLDIPLNKTISNYINISPVQSEEPVREPIELSMMSSDIDRDIPVSEVKNENTLVLIVANEQYLYMPTVPYAANDGNIFKEYCIKTLGIPQENIMYLTDATLNGFRQKVALLQKKAQARTQAGKETHIIFYYTGHGMPDVDTQSAYLMPIDGFDENVSTGYKLDNLYQCLGQMNVNTVTVFLDACFSGVNRNDQALAVHKGARLTAKSGVPTGNMVVFAASQGNQTASVNDKEKHGLFTYCMLKKLKETEGEISLNELAKYLISEVNIKSLDLFEKEQIPSVVASPEVENQWQNWKLK